MIKGKILNYFVTFKMLFLTILSLFYRWIRFLIRFNFKEIYDYHIAILCSFWVSSISVGESSRRKETWKVIRLTFDTRIYQLALHSRGINKGERWTQLTKWQKSGQASAHLHFTFKCVRVRWRARIRINSFEKKKKKRNGMEMDNWMKINYI